MDIERVMASSQSSAQAGSIVMPGTCHASQSWSQQKLPFILTQTVLMSSVTAAVKITNIVIAGLYCTVQCTMKKSMLMLHMLFSLDSLVDMFQGAKGTSSGKRPTFHLRRF